MRKKKKSRPFANTKPAAKKKKKKKAIRATKSAATKSTTFTLNVPAPIKVILAEQAKARGFPSWKSLAVDVLRENPRLI